MSTTGGSSPAKPIPRARPTPVAIIGAGNGSPARLGASPLSQSFRRGGRSVSDINGHSADDSNWRTRGQSVEKGDSFKGRGPERTVGGFEKSEVRAGGGGGTSALSSSKTASALAHVPCRFFKAGACTAGSSCPFSHDLGGKKEICQWFLKGDCKFGHKCALAHVRPGEPMSMDRRNKKEQQREARERADADRDTGRSQGTEGSFGTSPVTSFGAKAIPTPLSHPVPIKSAISQSLQSSSLQQSPGRAASSPVREPYGPPAAVGGSGSPSAGFNQPRLSGAPGFASSPSRPSPLSSSFNASGRPTAVAASLKGSSLVASHSPLRPPSASAAGGFSTSFSHPSSMAGKGSAQLSSSFADNQRSIWARSETPEEPLSPRRAPLHAVPRFIEDVFDEADDHGEDLLPSSLSDLLTPTERARRMSRNDSHDSHTGSPGRFANPHQFVGAERLAQSANAAFPPGDFLQSLWNKDGRDARQEPTRSSSGNATPEQLSFGIAPPQAPPLRQSLLSQQRNPASPTASSPTTNTSPPNAWKTAVAPAVDAPFLMRETDPHSPTARVLSEHAPGQSLPGGLAAALSRMHMQPRQPSGLGASKPATPVTPGQVTDLNTPPTNSHPLDHDEDELFHMDG